jgi:hypothetical protein
MLRCAVLQLKADYNDLCVMYPNEYCPFCKTLRYGATLELISVRTLAQQLCCMHVFAICCYASYVQQQQQQQQRGSCISGSCGSPFNNSSTSSGSSSSLCDNGISRG